MRFHTVVCVGLLALSSCVVGQDVASAFDGPLGGFGYNYGALYNSLDYRVPYFAAHPPVYYSAPVPRTYGHSPFAYPPYFRTPEIVPDAAGVTIVNPFAATKESTPRSSSPDQLDDNLVRQDVPSLPLIVTNPYANQSAPVVQVSR